MRKGWEGENHATTWRVTVSMMLSDRHLGETHLRRRKDTPTGQGRVLAAVSHWEKLPSPSQDILSGLREGAHHLTPQAIGIGPKGGSRVVGGHLGQKV